MDLPLNIDPDAPPEHLRKLPAWYREYAKEADRAELTAHRLSVAEALDNLAEHADSMRRSSRGPAVLKSLHSE